MAENVANDDIKNLTESVQAMKDQLELTKKELALSQNIQNDQTKIIDMLQKNTVSPSMLENLKIGQRAQMQTAVAMKIPHLMEESLRERYVIASDMFTRMGTAYTTLKTEKPDVEHATKMLEEGLRLCEIWMTGFHVQGPDGAKWKFPQLYYSGLRNMAFQPKEKWDFDAITFKVDDKVAADVKGATSFGGGYSSSGGSNHGGQGKKRWVSNSNNQPPPQQQQQPGQRQNFGGQFNKNPGGGQFFGGGKSFGGGANNNSRN
jgi:hypothetical protein